MKKKKILILFLFVFCIVAGYSIETGKKCETYCISGFVKVDGVGKSGIQVSAVETKVKKFRWKTLKWTKTDENGNFTICDMKKTKYDVTATLNHSDGSKVRITKYKKKAKKPCGIVNFEFGKKKKN